MNASQEDLRPTVPAGIEHRDVGHAVWEGIKPPISQEPIDIG